MVVPYAPGGGADVITRALAPIMERVLGQPAVVENRPGGGTALASTYVAQARPDGYTLLMGATPLAINPALQPSLTPRDPIRELAPVGPVYRNPFLLHVHASLPVRTLGEFITYAKANPGRVNYGSAGTGTVNHLAFALLANDAGLEIEHVPYRGSAPALLDLRANRVQAMFSSALEAQPLLQEGVTRALAVSSATRLPLFPDVPPVADTARGFDVAFWQGLFAPVGTPDAVIARLAEALRAGTGDPELRRRMSEQGVELMVGGPADLARMLAEETRVWARVVRDANIRVD
ncbi:tripartite tricarboxylate transporter substrate binding protein [Roseomonas sp. CAU 1739]|uniref:Bug family tripartite tricarboxylate transporter substrate binding protein n=1 Tax=Roseomonas sp. CAU 1739 TaxID=3140364 RepID=UPI00325B33A8